MSEAGRAVLPFKKMNSLTSRCAGAPVARGLTIPHPTRSVAMHCKAENQWRACVCPLRGPGSDISRSLDHLVGECEEVVRDIQARASGCPPGSVPNTGEEP